jgi:hypothetical protein
MKIDDVEVGQIVCDVRRNVAGMIKAIHEPGTYISPVNRKPVLARVVEFDTGETFVADAAAIEHFELIEGPAEQFYRDVQTAVTTMTKAICGGAAKLKIPPKTAFLILGRAFQVQGGILIRPEEGEPDGWDAP